MVNALKCARNVWVSIFAAPGLIVALLERFSGHCADIRVSGSNEGNSNLCCPSSITIETHNGWRPEAAPRIAIRFLYVQ